MFRFGLCFPHYCWQIVLEWNWLLSFYHVQCSFFSYQVQPGACVYPSDLKNCLQEQKQSSRASKVAPDMGHIAELCRHYSRPPDSTHILTFTKAWRNWNWLLRRALLLAASTPNCRITVYGKYIGQPFIHIFGLPLTKEEISTFNSVY